MTIRERIEKEEKEILSPYACLSMNSKGRKREEEPCDIRPVFQRDRDRILHSKSFRRLKDKTQVFLLPLRLNEDLVEAIALGHDLGHTPFGHSGERILNEICPHGFKHNEQSVRTVDILEKDGQGLNLTYEVLDGILNHQTSCMPSTLEGKIVRLSDKIAYFHHDMDDAIRAGILTEDDVPMEIRKVLGFTTGERLDRFIHDIVTNSLGKDDIIMSPPVAENMVKLKEFMYDSVYRNPVAKKEEGRAKLLISNLYDYYLVHTEALPDELKKLMEKGESEERVVCDHIAGMTDRFAIAKFEEIYIPKVWYG